MTTVYDFFTQGCVMWKLCALIPYKKKLAQTWFFYILKNKVYVYLESFQALTFTWKTSVF